MSALILPALWALLCAFPPVLRGYSAGHSLLFVLKPDGPINPDGSGTEWAHVQEKGEFRLCKLAAIALALPCLWLPAPVVWFAVPLTLLLGDQLARSSGAVDYAGHGAEIMAAEADGAFGYREAEIGRMGRNADKRGDDIPAMLARWRWLARVVFVLGRV